MGSQPAVTLSELDKRILSRRKLFREVSSWHDIMWNDTKDITIIEGMAEKTHDAMISCRFWARLFFHCGKLVREASLCNDIMASLKKGYFLCGLCGGKYHHAMTSCEIAQEVFPL